ncbi:tyrosyl-tRNA ligase [Rhodococcus ruber BKS 20-38]|uniref:Tyrosyl-tRNA ligase n=1 Tax=Rhodococcus ruber BKS 20-38 TaxID=1278076 RepID=M2YQK0_9NOCA|nr:tyrosyl-tRNA ligase [Rhodococcus ruber BKS 20-38]
MAERILDELGWRGLIAHSTDLDTLRGDLDAGPVTFYTGFSIRPARACTPVTWFRSSPPKIPSVPGPDRSFSQLARPA